VGVDGQALGENHVGYSGVNTTTNTLVRWTGTAWAMVMDSPKLVTGPKLTLYVSQNTGNDNNDGLTSGTAWKTVSKLYQELMQYNFLEKQVDVHLGAGTYQVRFPSNVEGRIVRVYGVSSNSVTIQRLDITNRMDVTIQGVTVGFAQIADGVYFHWPIVVSNAGNLNVGPDVVFGPIGNFLANRNMRHITCLNGSSVNFYANSPVTITGSVNGFCAASDSSSIIFNTYGGGPSSAVMTAPAVSNGATYNLLYNSLTASDTLCTINCTGSLSIATFFAIAGSSRFEPSKSVVTGSVTGIAYNLTTSSYINGNVVRGTPTGNGIGFPTSISPGTKDTSSTIYGTTF